MSSMRPWEIEETAYPATRFALENFGETFDDEEVEEIIREAFPGAYPEDVENFLRRLRRFGRQASPLVQRALPGMIQGAVQGGTVGGPWGALAGAGIGGATSLLAKGSPGKSTAPARTAAKLAIPTKTVMPTKPTVSVVGTAKPAMTGAGEPTKQLLALLSRPETMQALMSLAMSNSGRSMVRVGNKSVPVAAFANAISELAAEVSENYTADVAGSLSDYLLDSENNLRVDVVNPAERAALLISDLAEVAVMEMEDEVDNRYESELDDQSFYSGDSYDGYDVVYTGEEY